MISSRFSLKRFLLTLLVFAGVSFACTETLYSQTTTGMIRGTVTVAGAAAANAQVQVRNPQTGVSRGATVHDDGSYALAGLPPATYEMTVRRIGSEPQTRTVVVLIGATQTQNFDLSAAVTQLGTVFVQAAATAETQTSEVATNVTQQQINNLPTPGRNILDLAALAPGTRVTLDRLDGTNKTFAAGAQRSDQINVFVDGASYKNDIIQGGVAGQSFPEECAAGIPHYHLELQGRISEIVERNHYRSDQVRDKRMAGERVHGVSERGLCCA